jgi:hypothetical protein
MDDCLPGKVETGVRMVNSVAARLVAKYELSACGRNV